MTAQSYHDHLEAGFQPYVVWPRAVRPNIWGTKISAIAHRLGDMEVPPPVSEVLCELFEEIGKLTRQAEALGCPR